MLGIVWFVGLGMLCLGFEVEGFGFRTCFKVTYGVLLPSSFADIGLQSAAKFEAAESLVKHSETLVQHSETFLKSYHKL